NQSDGEERPGRLRSGRGDARSPARQNRHRQERDRRPRHGGADPHPRPPPPLGAAHPPPPGGPGRALRGNGPPRGPPRAARAAAAIDYGMCEVAFLLFADTHVLEDRTDHSHSYRREWTDPYGLMGPPGAFGLLSRAYEAKYGLDYRMLGKLAVTQRNHAL